MNNETIKQINIFGKHIEQSALDQFTSAMSQPFSLRGALMADAHTGYTLPIGGVIETDGVIVPAWVGYDIGCGVCAIKTTFDRSVVESNKAEIFRRIYELIPVGRNHNYKPGLFRQLDQLPRTDFFNKLFAEKNGLYQMCSLGSGNHFIEIGYDECDNVWVVIHSGSRGIGHDVAEHYMKLAANSDKPIEDHFGFDISTSNGFDYINDMNMCLAFALENRRQMINNVCAIIYVSGNFRGEKISSSFINRNHNHAELHPYGRRTVIHRKGATHAELGMMGVIPGNWEDGSFVVRGKGNTNALCSSSHGAGRIMSRGAARRSMNVETERKRMSDKGIIAKIDADTIDEAKGAYKDIFEVMELQKDLIEVVHHIKPIINVKG